MKAEPESRIVKGKVEQQIDSIDHQDVKFSIDDLEQIKSVFLSKCH
jgi:hypothetical protein